MRIIAGKAKGRRLKSRKNSITRPTQDRIKEALFSMLGGSVPDSRGIDLFAGFGGLGLEAISRGAKYFTFVEKNYKNTRVIKENIKLCGFEDRAEIAVSDVIKYIDNYGEAKVDLIFMDPPYGEGYAGKVINKIIEDNIIKLSGLIVVEHHKNNNLPVYKPLKLLRDRQYGDTIIKIYSFREEGC